MINQIIVLALLGCMSIPVHAQVNGYYEEIEGIPVFHVWGTDFEMGYALGYLDGDRWAILIEQVLVLQWGGPSGWETARTCFTTYFMVPPRADDIVDGMLEGIGDRPDSVLYSASLGRYYDDLDLHVSHSLSDIAAVLGFDDDFSCSSFTSWDAATASDPELQGAPALSRNVDLTYSSVASTLHAVIALNPDIGNQTVQCSFPCDFGRTSAMNEYGICMTRNSSVNDDVTTYTPAFVSLSYAALMGLLEDDFNGSGTNDLEDILSAMTYWNRAPSMNLHTVAPRALGYQGEPSVVIEINNDSGYVFRYADDDPILGPDHLGATNHFRLLYPPLPCFRYEMFCDSITADPDMTLERFWDFMGYCDLPGVHTYVTVLFMPEAQKIGLAFCDAEEESWEKDPVWLTWDQLFPPTGIEDEGIIAGYALSLFPNPSEGSITAEFTITTGTSVQLSVYDITGRMVMQNSQCDYAPGNHLVEFHGLSDGLYFCRMFSVDFTETQRFVVIE